jgi:uncharacterized protein (DUF58 family)
MVNKKNAESFLDEEFLRRLENLKILSHRGLTALDKGEHVSWRSGPSLEFLDYRKYQLGDDFRYVDWNVYGRLDKLFIKLFRAEQNQNIHTLLDISRSMEFGRPLKETYAKKILAALSYIGLTQLDNIYVTAFSDKLNDSMIPVKSGLAYSKVLDFLVSIQVKGKTRFNASLTEYAETRNQRGIAIILSDLMDPNGFEAGLEALRHAGFDVSVIQVLDHQEIFPSDTGNRILKEIEANEKLNLTIDRSILTLYFKKFQNFLNRIQVFCLNNGIDYYLCDTSVPFEDRLLEYITSSKFFSRYGSER